MFPLISSNIKKSLSTNHVHDLVHIGVYLEVTLPVLLGRLQVDNDDPAPVSLGQQGIVTTGHDLQGGAQAQAHIRLSASHTVIINC